MANSFFSRPIRPKRDWSSEQRAYYDALMSYRSANEAVEMLDDGLPSDMPLIDHVKAYAEAARRHGLVQRESELRTAEDDLADWARVRLMGKHPEVDKMLVAQDWKHNAVHRNHLMRILLEVDNR